MKVITDSIKQVFADIENTKYDPAFKTESGLPGNLYSKHKRQLIDLYSYIDPIDYRKKFTMLVFNNFNLFNSLFCDYTHNNVMYLITNAMFFAISDKIESLYKDYLDNKFDEKKLDTVLNDVVIHVDFKSGGVAC